MVDKRPPLVKVVPFAHLASILVPHGPLLRLSNPNRRPPASPRMTDEIVVRPSTAPTLDDIFRLVGLAVMRFRRWVRRHEPLLTALLETWARYNALDRSGWLPHHTTPFHLLDPAETDPVVSGKIVSDYYEAEWPVVEAAFRLRLEEHGFDAETLATFNEALIAHRHRLYRTTARTLFPDIERKARDVLSASGVETNSGLWGLRKAVESLGMENFTRAGVVSPKLYRMFARHLYSNVKTAARLTEVAGDPVPNRHAALHGLVVYTSGKSSLNALIMSEYVHLSILAVARALAEREAASRLSLPPPGVLSS